MRFHWMHRFGWDNGLDGLLKMSKDLDDAGIYSVLLPYGSYGPDFLIHTSEMARNTKNLKFMIALRPYTLIPEYASKIFKTFQNHYGNKLVLNVVAGALSPEETESVLENYPGNPSDIDTIDKRIALADKWTEIFIRMMGNRKPEMYTIANSPITTELGNKYFDGVIFNYDRIEYNSKHSVVSRKIVTIDPLIDVSQDEVEYYKIPSGQTQKNRDDYRHDIAGSFEEVADQIRDISKNYGINDFMIHTNQKNVDKMLKLVRTLSNE